MLLSLGRLALSIGPIAATPVAATQEVADLRETSAARKIAAAIARQIATDIANATLRMQHRDTLIAVATMGDAAAMGALANQCQACEDAMPANCPIAESGTTGPAGVLAVRTANALVGRDVSLIDANRGEDGTAHV